MGEAKELLELIKKRDNLRKSENNMTIEIKQLRKKIWESKRKPKGNIQNHPLLKEARHKLIALRLSCRKALRKAGYSNKDISKIMNTSYTNLLTHEYKLIHEARNLERKDFYHGRCQTET